jgi:hypothetical protein
MLRLALFEVFWFEAEHEVLQLKLYRQLYFQFDSACSLHA